MSVADDHDPAKAGDGGLNPQNRPKGQTLPATAEAVAAAGRGWRVLPVAPGEKAALLKSWPRAASDDPAKVAAWAARYPGCNFGVLCGRASEIVVLDVDPRSGGTEKLDALEREHGPLPVTAEVLTGGGGRHLYFANPGQTIRSRKVGPGVECRAERLYVVLPGSTHPNGNRYAWRDGRHPDQVALADAPGWLLDADLTHACDCHVVPEPGGDAADPGDPLVAVAIHATLPNGPGQRNRLIFEFARRLKAMPGLAGRRAVELRPLVLAWHRAALPFIRTKAADETLADFATAWRNVRHARGDELADAVRSAADDPDPPNIEAMGYGDDTRFAVRLCRRLQLRRGDRPFMLAARVLAGAMSRAGHPMTHETAAGRLRLLVADEVLAVAAPADRAKRRATEYRYLTADAGGEGGAA